jgi:hypothetical protein
MVDQAKGAVGQDAEVDALLKEFDSDKALVGSHVAEGQVANYRTMPAILLAALQSKNSSVVDANDQVNKVQADKTAAENREATRATTAEAARDVAVTDLGKEKETYSADRTRINDEKAKIAAQLAVNDKKFKADIDQVSQERDSLNSLVGETQVTVNSLKSKVKDLESEQVNLFEAPDGKIAWVNQRQRLAWIDAGRADGLMRQTTFSVFDHDINGITNAKPKGRIEVIRLSDEHMAECRILEDTPSNPLLPGDVIHTPTWSPGQRLHFALAGVMDIDGDRINDYEMVKNIITLNGGVIDAELLQDGTRVGKMDINTRYLVLGELPDEKSPDKARQEFTRMQEEVQRYGTDIIPVQKLLTQMGRKSEERTVELAGSGGGAAFRARKPGVKPVNGKPAEGAAPAVEPVPAGEAAPAADPFAAPAADPFAPPAPAPPAAEADPFAVPK